MKFTPIGAKIIKKFLIVITILGALNVSSLYYIKKIERSYSDLVNRRAQIITLVQDLQTDVSEQNSKFRAYLLTSNPEYLQRCKQFNVRISEGVEKTLPLTKLEVNKELLKKIATENVLYKQKIDEITDNTPNDQEAAVERFDSTVIPISEEMMNVSENLLEFHQSYMEEGASFNSDIVNKSIMISIIIMFIDILITVYIVRYYNVKMRLLVPPYVKKG